MRKFVIKNIEEVNGRQECKQLVINKDGNEEIGVFDEFGNYLERKYSNLLAGIIGIMNRVANLETVSPDKFKDITPRGELVKEFEFKYRDLRVYAIKIFNGKLVVLCGYKNSQKKDIVKFRSLKKQYIESIKQ
ncbi:MAG: hypothetical protein Q8891_11710 [Bacteroidota bacterium]|nr:hypothetical protein [Bacteroidota bacterium]